MGAYTFVERRLAVGEYQSLRRAVGWQSLGDDAVARGLAADLYTVCVECAGATIGCARIIGDGAIYFYLQDVIVLPAHQGRGVGAQIMARLMAYLQRHAHANSFVGLMAAVGVAPFYERYGFRPRPDDGPGMFLRWGG